MSERFVKTGKRVSPAATGWNSVDTAMEYTVCGIRIRTTGLEASGMFDEPVSTRIGIPPRIIGIPGMIIVDYIICNTYQCLSDNMLNRGGFVILAFICCVMAVGCVDDGTISADGIPSEEFQERVNESLESQEYYDTLVQSDPDNAEAWFIRGMYYNANCDYQYSNQYDEALKSCNKALELDPEYGEAWYLRGIILMNMNRHCESLPCFENATKYDPELASDAHKWYVWNEKKCSQ